VGLQFERNPQVSADNPNSIGVGFSVPLFVRHRYAGEIRRAEADQRLAAENFHATLLDAKAERARAAAELNGARERVEQFKTAIVEKANSTAQAAEYAYSHGALDLTDLLDARRAMQAITLDALSAQSAYAKALSSWRAANDVYSTINHDRSNE
jgi:cobalt-zinc-cadmium efflux system outer membrane protein